MIIYITEMIDRGFTWVTLWSCDFVFLAPSETVYHDIQKVKQKLFTS